MDTKNLQANEPLANSRRNGYFYTNKQTLSLWILADRYLSQKRLERVVS